MYYIALPYQSTSGYGIYMALDLESLRTITNHMNHSGKVIYEEITIDNKTVYRSDYVGKAQTYSPVKISEEEAIEVFIIQNHSGRLFKNIESLRKAALNDVPLKNAIEELQRQATLMGCPLQ